MQPFSTFHCEIVFQLQPNSKQVLYTPAFFVSAGLIKIWKTYKKEIVIWKQLVGCQVCNMNYNGNLVDLKESHLCDIKNSGFRLIMPHSAINLTLQGTPLEQTITLPFQIYWKTGMLGRCANSPLFPLAAHVSHPGESGELFEHHLLTGKHHCWNNPLQTSTLLPNGTPLSAFSDKTKTQICSQRFFFLNYQHSYHKYRDTHNTQWGSCLQKYYCYLLYC